MKKVLIVGGSRGIGLELAKQYKQRGFNVFVTCRKSTNELSSLDINIIEDVEVTSLESLKAARKKLESHEFDILIHNAGILSNESLNDLDFERIEKQFQVNSLGPLKSISTFKDLLGSGARVGILSSRMGSVEDNGSGGMYGYRMSKSACNMVGRSLAYDLAPNNISVAILHPGYVRTDMTSHQGNIDPSESARGLIAIMDKLNVKNSGHFWHTNGENLPW